MNLEDILIIKEDVQAPVQIVSATKKDSYLVINGYIAFNVVRISNSYDTLNSIALTLNTIERGFLIFTINKNISLNLMTEYEFIAYLTEANFIDYNHNDQYKFNSNYLLIKETFLEEYIHDYKDTSVLWGGFSHELITGAPSTRYKKVYRQIDLGEKLKPLDVFFYESAVRAIEQTYAFERFLKLYHLLELQFDYFIITKIQSLSIPTDVNKIGKIINDYSSNELSRLTDLIENYCLDISSLEKKLSEIVNFTTIAEEMFIDYGKSKNNLHLTDVSKFRDVVSSGSFLDGDLQRLKIHSNTDHSKFIINITAYWIYRIRCSIAHNKIGEYLLSWNNEDFIVEFGEPLLKEVLMQCFKK